jgi:hypothetical protein
MTSFFASQSFWNVSSSFASSSIVSLTSSYIKATNTLGIPFFNQSSNLGGWWQIDDFMQGNSYLGASERLIIDLIGGSYHSEGFTRYIVGGRFDITVDRFDFNGGLGDDSHALKVYNNLSSSISSSNKYIVGISVYSGSYWSIQGTAYQSVNGEYGKWTNTTEPSTGSLYSDDTPIISRYFSILSGSSYPIKSTFASSSISASYLFQSKILSTKYNVCFLCIRIYNIELHSQISKFNICFSVVLGCISELVFCEFNFNDVELHSPITKCIFCFTVSIVCIRKLCF